MNKEALTQRLSDLEQMEAVATKNLQQTQNDLQAISGAKQDVQYWLAKLAESEDNLQSSDVTPIKKTPGRKKKAA